MLIVESDPTIRAQLGCAVEAIGWTATALDDAGSALQAFRAEPFDLALLGWRPASRAGADLARRLRALAGGDRCVMIAISDSDEVVDLDEAIKIGIHDIVRIGPDCDRLSERLRLAGAIVRSPRRPSASVPLTRKVAHDFNNLLVGIVGHAGLAQLDLDPESPIAFHLEEIQAAAQRARELTHQLHSMGDAGGATHASPAENASRPRDEKGPAADAAGTDHRPAPAVLVLDEVGGMRDVVPVLLRRYGIEVVTPSSLDHAEELIGGTTGRWVAALVGETWFSGHSSDFVARLRSSLGAVPLIVCAAGREVQEQATMLGCEVLACPFPPNALLAKLRIDSRAA